MKKKTKIYLELFFSIIGLVLSVNTLSAQTNIAPLATPSTSYVSSWETLSAINDGFVPTGSTDHSHGAYGNWQAGVTNEWNWVQYTFPAYYKIAKSDVYWWTDNNGISIPYKSYLQYWNLSLNTWVNVTNPSGYGYEMDKFNTTSFDTILTNKVRLNFISYKAQGILEWKVYGEKGEQIPAQSTVYVSPALALGTTSTFTITARDKNGIPVSGYVFKLDATVFNTLSQNNEIYNVNGLNISNSQQNIVLPPTNASGVTTLTVSVPALVDPTDGINLDIKFNEGHTLLKSYVFVTTGLTPPVLTSDITSNTVDTDFDITFQDDAAWRSAITGVTVAGIPLDTADYKVTAGKITLKPDVNNGLSTVGYKLVAVLATGYTKTQTTQQVMAGTVDTLKSTVTAPFKLFKSTNVQFTAKAADKFGNPVSGYVFKWDAVKTNNGKVYNETYIVNGDTLTASVTGQVLAATNASGLTTFNVSIPNNVDLNDGLLVRFKTTEGETLHSTVSYVSVSTEKQIYVDNKLKTYEWSYSKSAQSDNFIVFWGDLVGPNPLSPANGNAAIAFDPTSILNMLEGYLKLYVDSFGIITNKTQGNMGKYKFMVVMTDTWNNNGYAGGYANGGSTDGVIGAMWINPDATGGTGFVLAHEFTHMCQAMIPIQYPGKGILDPADGSYNLGMFWESHANFMAITATGDVQAANPERFVNTSMMHFSSTNHYYENNYFLQYLFDKYGMESINKIWRNATQGEHPLMCLKANMSYTQSQLNDEFGQYAMRDVTWDYSIKSAINSVLRSQSYQVVCREYTVPDTSRITPKTYIVPKYMSPADYGYNIIPVFPDSTSSSITINFTGLANANAGGAGWRYGFVAVDANGNPRYSALSSASPGTATFQLTTSDIKVYLVVTGAPNVHHNYIWTPGWPKVYRYPYTFSMTGAVPAGFKAGYNNMKTDYPTGKYHTNGGGWIASTATVSTTAYVGPNAQILGSATVLGNARIEDYAIVTDNATISGNAIVRGNSMVGSTATVRENAIIEKTSRVFYTSDIFGNALITGSAIVYSSSVSGYAVVKDLAWINNAVLTGNVIIGGDAEGYAACSAGIYLQNNSIRNNDGSETSALNTDVNPEVPEYGNILLRPYPLTVTTISDKSATLSWTAGTGGSGNISYLILNGNTVLSSTNDLTLTLGSLSPKTSYVLTVVARDSEGNQSLRSNAVTITTDSVPSAIEEIQQPEGYRYYPNPANDKFTLECTGKAIFSIYDTEGQCVLTDSFVDKTIIPVTRLGHNGIFMIRLISGKQVVTSKIVIQSAGLNLN